MIKKKIGLDIGTVRIGIATSDILGMFASSYEVYRRRNLFLDAKYMAELAVKLDADTFVIGLPLKMNGEEGETAKEVRAFAEKLFKEIPLPYTFWDERLSSSAMEKFLIQEVDMSRTKRKQKLDASAAAYILQGALDRLKYL